MKILITFFFVSVLLFVVGMALVFPESFPLCEVGYGHYYECIDKYRAYDMEGAFLALFSVVFLFVSIIIYTYLKIPAAFHSWKKFAIIYLPIAIVILFVTAGESGGGIGLARIDSEIISWWLAGLFLSASLLIIAVKSWKLRKGK